VLGLTILVFLLQVASQMLLGGADLPAALGLKDNSLILSGQIWRLITPVFLHGSFLHIAFNMYALYALGPGLERHYGSVRFAALYFLSGFAGNVVSFLLSPDASLGSSTAIFGLLGAEGVFLYQNRSLFGGTARRALMNVVGIAAVNLVIGLSPGIDNWGHVGGLVGGALFAWLAGPILKVQVSFPYANLEDEREQGAAWRAGLVVAGLFGLLAGIRIFLIR
jgi:rhomboid protease GluP